MDRGARTIGMVMLICGTAILVFVFGIAYRMFTAPASQVFGVQPSGGGITGAGLGMVIALVFIRIALLFVMALAGSLIAARGIHLYLGGSETPHPGHEE